MVKISSFFMIACRIPAYFCVTVRSILAITIITAGKRSSGQGHVLQVSVCPWGRVLCMMPLPVWLTGPMFLLGGLCPREGSLSKGFLFGWSLCGGLCPGGLPDRPLSHMVTSGRYASYWNAFLFCSRITKLA